jgi:hypothetical protein
MIEEFAESFLENKTFSLFGRRLFPYNITHAIYFRIVDIDLSSEPTCSQMVILRRVLNCENALTINLKYRIEDSIYSLLMLYCKRFFLSQSTILNAYCKSYLSFPEFWENTDDQGRVIESKMSAPPELSRIAYLLGNTSLTLDEIYKMPYSRLSWITGALSEINSGKRQFVRDNEFEGLE